MTSEKNLENNLDGTKRTANFPMGPITRSIVGIVGFSRRFSWAVLALAAILTIASGYYAITHFAINTNTEDFISARLPWRQDMIAAQKAFPQRDNQILIVIDGKTTELAENAAAKLTAALKKEPDLFESVVRPDGGPYFNQSALLFLPLPELKTTLQQLSRSAPFLAVLSADPSLRGVIDAFSFIPRAVRGEAGTLEDFKAPMTSLNVTLQSILKGHPDFFSWRTLLTNEKPDAQELRRFITAKPVLDYAALMPGEAATDFIRKTAHDLNFGPGSGVTVRLTGPVPLADDEFSTVADGAGLNSALTALVVLFIIWRALHSLRIVFAVVLSVTAGLAITAALGLLMVGALNLISVAFAVLFVGIGADFCIQFSVRYRAERYEENEFAKALRLAAAKVGRPLALAAVATAVGFYSFLPTDYRGVSELGLIAGTGMFVAFFCSITVLPALLTILQPPAEQEPMGYAFLAPVDHFLSHHRHAVVFGTLALALLGSPLLAKLKFDFNPLNLRSDKVQSISTLLDLMKDPNTDTNTIDVMAPSLEATKPIVARLEKLPDVAKVMTLESLIPPDQAEKLPLIEATAKTLLPVLDPAKALTPPTGEDDIAALHKGANAFKAIAGYANTQGAEAARALAQSFNALADAPAATREEARNVFLPSLNTLLAQLREALNAKPVTVALIPADLSRDWIAADGQARIQVAPKGDPNDNANLVRFADQVKSIDPKATGEPIDIQESGKTVISAFIEAGVLALAAICVLLYVSLRRIKDVFLTIVPLLIAGVFTLEITVLIGLPLNFANIIALPLLLGLGVAFKIYFVMAWRAGTTNFLQSSLTRAVFFSALTTATAFGSLWLSNHPGTSSMGKLLALSLTCTLASAILFQPALMGPPRTKPEPKP